jgi:hypothetical protein
LAAAVAVLEQPRMRAWFASYRWRRPRLNLNASMECETPRKKQLISKWLKSQHSMSLDIDNR